MRPTKVENEPGLCILQEQRGAVLRIATCRIYNEPLEQVDMMGGLDCMNPLGDLKIDQHKMAKSACPNFFSAYSLRVDPAAV